MQEPHSIETFEDLCRRYSIWIIKYCSPNYETPLFLIWYVDTDEDSTNRLLTFKSGHILAFNSLTNVKAIIINEKNNITPLDNLDSWLNGFNELVLTENNTFDLALILTAINNKNLDIETIEGIANFINIYDDFVYQDKRNNHLEVYINDKLIKKVWDYFYKFIFWPRFNDKEKFETWVRPELKINTKKLMLKIKELMESFENQLRFNNKV